MNDNDTIPLAPIAPRPDFIAEILQEGAPSFAITKPTEDAARQEAFRQAEAAREERERLKALAPTDSHLEDVLAWLYEQAPSREQLVAKVAIVLEITTRDVVVGSIAMGVGALVTWVIFII